VTIYSCRSRCRVNYVGISSLRIEGTWMIIGQRGGIAAASRPFQDVGCSNWSNASLRERLLAQRQVLLEIGRLYPSNLCSSNLLSNKP